MQNMVLGVCLAIFGVGLVGVGVYILIAPAAEASIRNNPAFRTRLFPTRGLWGSIPGGIAIFFIGLATVLTDTSAYEGLMWAAIVFTLLTIVALVWAPDWIRPKWARSR